MKELITVTCTATKELAPDCVRIDVTVAGEDSTPEKANAARAALCDSLNKQLKEMGVKLTAGAMYTAQKYKDGKPIAFRAQQTLCAEFDYDVELLNGVMAVLNGAQVEWRRSYRAKKVEKARNELKKQAVQDARRHAAVLAEAAGVKLGNLAKIDYVSDGGAAPVMLRAVHIAEADVAPEPIRLSESVTCAWQLLL